MRRVITIGTPHRGSSFANSATSYLGAKLITQPMQLMAGRSQLLKDNPNYFHEDCLLEIKTSIDSLAPQSPFLKVLYETPPADNVKIHTIIGEVPPDSFLRRLAGTSDGVVHVSSAKLPGAASELIVPADHSHVHAHPRSVKEVRRILLAHLAETRNQEPRHPVQFAQRPDSLPAVTGQPPGLQPAPMVAAPLAQEYFETTPVSPPAGPTSGFTPAPPPGYPTGVGEEGASAPGFSPPGDTTPGITPLPAVPSPASQSALLPNVLRPARGFSKSEFTGQNAAATENADLAEDATMDDPSSEQVLEAESQIPQPPNPRPHFGLD